jgi:Ca2+-binding EF-hand superfamily protein
MKTQVLAMALAALCTAGLISTAAAQSARDPMQMLEQADRNGDGAITWAEVMASRESAFAQLDRNRNGFADRQDRPRIGGDRFDQAMRQFASADANRDGRISRSEFMNAPSPQFDAVDVNNDRVLSAAEIAAARARRAS